MPTYKLAVVEDREEHALALAALVGEVSCDLDAAFEVASFSSVGAFWSWMERGEQLDAILVDIEFEGEEPAAGIALVRELNRTLPGVQVVYVTGYLEYCTSVYETEHAYFLTKPVKACELRAALRKVAGILAARNLEHLTVSLRGRQMVIPTSTIGHLESHGRKVCIVCAEGPVEVYAKLSDILERLPEAFVQCHKSYVVNMGYVASVKADAVEMRSGLSIPVSKRRSKDVRAAWQRRLLGML